MFGLGRRSCLGLALALTAALFSARPVLALTPAQVAAINDVSAAATARFAQANQTGQLPRYKDPAAQPLLARLWNVAPLIGGGPWTSADVGPLLDLDDMEKAVFRAYVSHPKTQGGQADPAANEIEFHAEIFRSLATMLEIGAASVDALSDFMKTLPPDQINDARRQGVAQMRTGFKQVIAGAMLTLTNPRSPHDDADGILAKALAASAPDLASAMTKDDKAAIAATLSDALARVPAAQQGDVRKALVPFQGESCDALCKLG